MKTLFFALVLVLVCLSSGFAQAPLYVGDSLKQEFRFHVGTATDGTYTVTDVKWNVTRSITIAGGVITSGSTYIHSSNTTTPGAVGLTFTQLKKAGVLIKSVFWGGEPYWSTRPSGASVKTVTIVYECYLDGNLPKETLTFGSNLTNEMSAPVNVRLKINGAVKKTVALGPGTNSAPSHSEALEIGTSGVYSWEVQTPSGIWQEFYDGTYSVLGDGLTPTPGIPTMTFSGGSGPSPTPPPSSDPLPPPSALPPPVAPKGPASNPSQPMTGGSGGAPAVTAPRPNSGGGGGTVTQEDIYEGVRAALNQAGNGDTATPGIDTDFEVGDYPEGAEESRSALEQIDAKIDGVAGSVNEGKNALQNKIGDKTLKLPSVSGNQLVFTYSLPILGNVVIDLNPYTSQISFIRNLCLLVMYIAFWFYTVRVIRTSVA